MLLTESYLCVGFSITSGKLKKIMKSQICGGIVHISEIISETFIIRFSLLYRKTLLIRNDILTNHWLFFGDYDPSIRNLTG